MKNDEALGQVIGTCGCWIIFWLGFVGIGTFALNYTVDTWLMIAEKGTDFPVLAAFLLCLIPSVGQISVLAAVVTFIITFFI